MSQNGEQCAFYHFPSSEVLEISQVCVIGYGIKVLLLVITTLTTNTHAIETINHNNFDTKVSHMCLALFLLLLHTYICLLRGFQLKITPFTSLQVLLEL